MTGRDCGEPKKRNRGNNSEIHGVNRQNVELGKMSFKSEVSLSSQFPRNAMLRKGENDDAKSIDDLITSALL